MKYLILTGDDFGRSSAVNEAIERQHQAGLLTQASLMVNEPGAEEAVRIARRNPGLCVGLHLTLCHGRAAERSGITNAAGRFIDSPAMAGLRYALDPRSRTPLQREIEAQFAKFRALGFGGSQLDGHTHLHLHPTIFRLTRTALARYGFRLVRLVRTARDRSPLGLIFRGLSALADRELAPLGVRAADQVEGLRNTGRMTTACMLATIGQLPEGVTELYNHPGAEPEPLDFPRLREAIAAREIVLVSAFTLPPPQTAA
ncbi:MAG TPA: ChbG/HpnK family deacetylase [Chthoniobacteraceae bacterium]|nr:ChbG/HpnK family deacetylase [Chthoniobacteraceae bacterium]